jgi:hypothetical protein
LVYAVVGIGDLAVEKVRSVRRFADRQETKKVYTEAIKRGRTLSRKAQNTSAGKKVVVQTEIARQQLQDTTKTVTKAFGVNVVSWPTSRTGRSRKTATRKTAARKTAARKTTSKAS